MSTLRRAPKRFATALVCTLCLLDPAAAAEPAVVVEGLAQPTAIAVRPGPRGGVELAIAEAGAGCVTSVVLLGEERHGSSTLVEGLGAESRSLAWAADGVLLVAGDGLDSYACDQPGEPAPKTASAGAESSSPIGLTSVAATDRHAFAVGASQLWRSRRVADRFTALRSMGSSDGDAGDDRVVGVTIHPLGYVVTLVDARLSQELHFLDPEKPTEPGQVTVVTGLEEPFALAYGAVPRPSEPLLYALQSDGVYRLDASGAAKSTARRVAAVQSAKAMALGPDGALYVVTADESHAGVVLRFAGDY